MIAVNKADECIQGEISRYEEISGIRPNKSRVVGQHMKGPNNETNTTCEKRKTNKKKVKVTSAMRESRNRYFEYIMKKTRERKGISP
eukprot:188418-Prorocentrum_minimum.AAC.1